MITTRTLAGFVIAGVLLLAGCTHRVSSGPYAMWELRGAIVDVTGERLRVRHKTGQVVDLVLDDQTKVTRDDKPATHDALRRGVRVRIVVEPLAGGGQRAQLVRLFGDG